MRCRLFFFGILLALAPMLRAQGGPPFITDDPGTVPDRHWEINFGFMADHNPASASYSLPNLDINYGVGKRTQLKFEIPIAASTDEHNTTVAGPGDSLIGIKRRLWEYHSSGERPSDENLLFSLGTYPQVQLSNPTRSVRRGVVDPGPQYYLPLEATAKIGWLALNGELGRWIGNAHVPDRWARGIVAGHSFSDAFELYAELYDLQDIDHNPGETPGREFTLDAGGRRSFDRKGKYRLLFMGGRSIQAVSRQNHEPSWIAYLGVQVHLGAEADE